ncbi:MAG: 50S ribosomal protein L25 [Chlamydiota bacterium]|nr:50S ribosomal protein L25 [Chlamydiota bacterium]
MMNLKMQHRTVSKKSDLRAIRKEGNIPASIYVKEGVTYDVTIDGADFKRHLRKAKPGLLSTTRFTLNIDGAEKRAIIKEIQYAKISDPLQPIHLDFQILNEDRKINVNIPILISGSTLCPGVKMGGRIRQVVRRLRVSCLSKKMPSSFSVNVSQLEMGEAVRVSDIDLGECVTQVNPRDAVVVIAKK